MYPHHQGTTRPMQRVYPGLSPNIPEGWVMAPRPIKRKTPTAGFQVAVEGSAHGCSRQPKPMRRGSPCTFALPTRPVLSHRQTDANTQTHGTVNPLPVLFAQLGRLASWQPAPWFLPSAPHSGAGHCAGITPGFFPGQSAQGRKVFGRSNRNP